MNKYKLKLSIVNCQLSIIAAMLLLLGCQQSEELHTAPSPIQLTIDTPPAWYSSPQMRGGAGLPAEGLTRATPVVWTDGDQLCGTITFIHASGLKDAPVPFVYNLADETFVAPTPTWPVGQDVSHAILSGAYGIDADGNRIDGGTVPLYHTQSKAEAGQPFNITLTHATAGITFVDFAAGATATVADATGTIPAEAGATLTLYPELEADATQATVVVGSKSYTITAGAEQNGLLGRMYTLSGEKIGGTNPGSDSEMEKRIAKAKPLLDFAAKVNGGETTLNFTLTEDIDLTGITWTPIGNYDNPYKGIFDGGGHTITGLTINSTDNYQGFFGYIMSAFISNVHLREVDVTGDSYSGALVGQNSCGIITACSATGSVKGGEHTGGLIGVNDGTITACYATGNVEGSYLIGGLIGGNNGTIAACYATSNVVGNGIGGLVGNNFGAITACYATGNIEGSNAGALVGNNLGICNYNNANGKVNGTVAYDNLIGNNSNYIPIGNSSYLQDKVFEIYNFTLTANGVNDTWPATVKIAVTNADGTVSAKNATIDKKEIWNQTDLSLNRDAIKVVP